MKLSVIIPIYNVEPYLRRCVDSVLDQDFKDYEIILVDDGSTDNSGAICDEYLNHQSQITNNKCSIRVIHQPNGGLSAARNSGIKIANGDYLMFVDSDDYIEPNVLGELMTQIERDSLDVLRFKYQNVRKKDNGVYDVFNPYKRDARLGNDYTKELTDGVTFLNTRMNTQCYAWAFILRRDLIYSQLSALDSCLFTEGIFFEDTEWTPRMLCRAKRVASTNTLVYNYLVREGSITNAVNRSKQKKVLDDKIRLIGEIQRQANELAQKGLSNAWFSRMIADTVISILGIIAETFFDERKSYLNALLGMHVFPINSRSIKGRLINLSPQLFVLLLHIKNG